MTRPPNIYRNIYGQKLELTLKNDNKQFLEVTLWNSRYSIKKYACQRNIVLLVLSYFILVYMFSQFTFMISFVSILMLLFYVYKIYNLLEKETVKTIKGLALEKSSHYAFNRTKTFFIPNQNIHKIVINEVIYFVIWIRFQLETREIIIVLILFSAKGHLCAATIDQRRYIQ